MAILRPENIARLFSRAPTAEHGETLPTTALSHVLLSGLHIRPEETHAKLLQKTIASASWNRLPIKAIDTVSTAERKNVDAHLVSAEEKNIQHEVWLGRKAQQVVRRATEKKYVDAYHDLFGIDIPLLLQHARENALQLIQQTNQDGIAQQPLPADVVGLVDSYREYLQKQRKNGQRLSGQEEIDLSLEQVSPQLLQHIFAWEAVKDFLHTQVYVPFLKEQTDSKKLVDFVLKNYTGAHRASGVQIEDITQKAQLLREDFDDMTAKGYTIVGLIRSAAVIATGSQEKEAKEFVQFIGQISDEQKRELHIIASQQQHLDAIATDAVATEIHGITREVVRTIHSIHKQHGVLSFAMDEHAVTQRTEAIIQNHIRPLLAAFPLLSTDPDGAVQQEDTDLLYRLAHIPDLLHLQKALSVLQHKNHQATGMMHFRNVLSQHTPQAHIAEEYTSKYFSTLQQEGRVAPHILSVLQSSKTFRQHVTVLASRHGLFPEELMFLLYSHVLRAEKGAYDVELYGRSELGPAASGPLGNEDRYYQDDRLKLIMAADGAGSAKWSKSSAVIMYAASKTVMNDLWEKGVRYPLTQQQAEEALIEIVRRGANKMWDLLSPATKEHITDLVVDSQTGHAFHPSLHLLESYFMTTFVGVVPFVRDGVEHVAVTSVGDSRAYIHRATGELVQITRDDSYLWEQLQEYEATGQIIDAILNNFDADIPLFLPREDKQKVVSDAIAKEVVSLSLADKELVVEDMIDFLSKTDLSMTLSEMRTIEGRDKYDMLHLQQFLGEDAQEGMIEGRDLNTKVAAIVKFFYSRRNLLSRYISPRSGYIAEDDVYIYRLNPGDTVYVASDGVSDNVSEELLADTLNVSATLEERVDRVHTEALAALGCERIGHRFVPARNGIMSVRAKPDNGITFGGLQMTRRLAPEVWDTKETAVEEIDSIAA